MAREVTTASFNEATVQRPWKVKIAVANVTALVASMRPRFRDRGRTRETSGDFLKIRGFNEATVQRPWKGIVCPNLRKSKDMLQ